MSGDEELRQAVAKKELARVKALLARGHKLAADDEGARALAVSLWRAGDVAALDDPDAALLAAVESDGIVVVRALLEHGADPNARDAEGRSPLLIAKKRGHKAIAKLVAERGGKLLGALCTRAGEGLTIFAKTIQAALAEGDRLDAGDGEGHTALHLCARAGDVKSVKALIAAGAPLDAADHDGSTALLYALQHEQYEIAALLEDAGADVAKGDPAVWSVAAHYLGHGLIDRAKAAVKKGSSTQWLVHAAAGSGDVARVVLAIELGGRADAVTKVGWTAARSAAASGKREVLDEVVRLGSPVRFALHGAVGSGDAALVRHVLERYAPDVNDKDGWQRAALHESMFGGLEIIRLLLEAGADANVPDDEGTTPIFYAVDRENPELVRLLIAHGAEVDRPNGRGEKVSERARWASEEVKRALGMDPRTS